MDHKYKNNPGRFCYICGNVVLTKCQTKITDFVKKAYHDYFGVKLGDQLKPFTPYARSKICVKNLRDWRNGKTKSIPFAIPMVWREGKVHIKDGYFCMINLKGWRIQARRGWPVSTLDTCRTQRSDTKPNPFKGVRSAAGFTSQREISIGTKNNVLLISKPWEREGEGEGERIKTVFLRSRTNYHLINPSMLLQYNIAGLIKSMGLERVATKWRLFIESSSRSLKAVLLHTGNSFSSILIGHSV